MITHVYPNQNLLSTQQKRKNLFRRFRDSFTNVQSNGVVTLRQDFVDLDRRINDNNFEVDKWGFRAFWHSCGFTETELEYFFQECAAISAAQLHPPQQNPSPPPQKYHGQKQNRNNSNGDDSNLLQLQEGQISVDLAEAAVFIRRSLDCRRQQVHDILKRIRAKKLHPKSCPFSGILSRTTKNQTEVCSRLVVFDYLTKDGGLSHSEAFLLMDACSTPKQQKQQQNVNNNKSSSSHNIGSGKFTPENPQYHQASLLSLSTAATSTLSSASPVNQSNSKDADLDVYLLASCIFVFPLPDSIAFSLLLGKVVDALCDSFRGAGPTGITSIVNAAARFVTKSTPEELEQYLSTTTSSSLSKNKNKNGNNYQGGEENDESNDIDIRLTSENFAQICNSIAAGMPRAECILLHSFLAEQEFGEEEDDGENNNNDATPTVSLQKFLSSIRDRIPILSDSAFEVTIAEARHHILATSGGFSGLFQSLVRAVRTSSSGRVLDRAGTLAAFRSINVSSAFLPDITVEQIVTHFLARNRNFFNLQVILQLQQNNNHNNSKNNNKKGSNNQNNNTNFNTTTVLMFLRSFVETLRGRVSLGRMEIVEKLFHRLTDGVLTSQIKMLSSIPPTSSNNGDNFETTRENRRRAIASLLDEDEFEILMGEMDQEELARRRQVRDSALYQPLLRATDVLACFAPDLVAGGGGTQRTKLQKTALRCDKDLRAYLRTLEKLLSRTASLEGTDDDDDEDNDGGQQKNQDVSPNMLLSLADFGFFWANFSMTVQDDSEFTIILWEGFSMHKALSSTNDQKAMIMMNKNNHNTLPQQHQENQNSSSTATTPRRSTVSDNNNRNHKKKLHAQFRNNSNDSNEPQENDGVDEENDNRTSQQQNSPRNVSSIATLIAASHDEERKRRLHIERLASNSNSKNNKNNQTPRRATTPTTSSSSVANIQQQQQYQTENNANQNRRSSPITKIPRYHHHYHQPHAHEERNEQTKDFYQDDDNNHDHENDYYSEEASSLSSSFNNQQQNHQGLPKSSQRARQIVDRSQDVVAEFERQRKINQEKYKLWEEAAKRGPYENQKEVQQPVEALYPGYGKGRGRIQQNTPNNSNDQKNEVVINNESKNVLNNQLNQQNNNNAFLPQYEGQIVGYTQDGRPIVLKKIILPPATHHHHHQDPYQQEEKNGDYYNDDDDEQDEEDFENEDESQNQNNNSNNIVPPSFIPPQQQQLPQQQPQQNSAQRKRLPTSLEAYQSGEEKLLRDIAAFHQSRVAVAVGQIKKDNNQNKNQNQKNVDGSNGKKFEGFLPNFGVVQKQNNDGASPAVVNRLNNMNNNSGEKNKGKKINNFDKNGDADADVGHDEKLPRVQQDPIHPDICRKKFIKPQKTMIAEQMNYGV